MDANRPLCGHLITHLDPEIDAFMKEKFGMDFSQMATMGVAEWAVSWRLDPLLPG